MLSHHHRIVIKNNAEWFLRDYKIEPSIWDGDPNCQHDWDMNIIIEKKGSGSMYGRIANEQGIECKTSSAFNNISKRKEGFCLKCGAWKGVLGLEPSFELYIKHLCDIYDLVWRVLKPSGINFVNLGDSYNGTGGGHKFENRESYKKYNPNINYFNEGKNDKSLSQKCLLMIPYRFAIEMCNRGWILRNVLIWHKKNCMPSSARDRFTVDFEPMFFFTKSKRYWFDQDAVREKSDKNSGWVKQREKGVDNITPYQTEGNGKWAKPNIECNPNGRNKRCVWTINTVGNPEAHFATFPLNLVKPMILSGCPKEVCKKCGKPRERIIETVNQEQISKEKYNSKYNSNYGQELQGFVRNNSIKNQRDLSRIESKKLFFNDIKKQKEYIKKIHDSNTGKPKISKGWSDCGCNEGFKHGIMLDIFAGTGTTLLQAWELGRDYVGFEISKEYCKMIEKRLKTTQNKRMDDFF